MKVLGDSVAVLALYALLSTGSELASEFKPANRKSKLTLAFIFKTLDLL